ncbi:MAG: tryptophan synthase subunit alpha [Bacillota bacterium]|nr:tryptophan synthase subunit alpha [Bacillota bacterium]
MLTINRINKCITENNKQGKKLLITYFMAGDPGLAECQQAVLAAIAAGADMIELGIPFSDPLADGPVIEAAGLRALAKGMNVSKVFALIESLRQATEVPIIIMTYLNPIYKYGVADFAAKASAVGADGLIIPDLPFGEDEEVFRSCKENNLELIPLVAASTNDSRLAAIGARQPAFIYGISVNGTTGVRKTVNPLVQDFSNNVRIKTNRPVAVGFGIGTGEQAKIAAKNCDAVIVGSAIVDIIANNINQEDEIITKVAAKVAELKQALVEA